MTHRDGPDANRTMIARPSPLEGAQAARGPAARVHSALVEEDDVPSPPVSQRPRNVLMSQAGPILARISAQRIGRLRMPLQDLHREMHREIKAFEARITPVYPAETVNRAVYAVCATVDDVAMGLQDQAADVQVWAQHPMTYLLFGNTIGGDEFVVLMRRLLERPDECQDLIELFHACMAAGFGGRIRVSGGAEGSQVQMQSMFNALAHPRQTSATTLSPRWKGVNAPARTTGVWGGVALAALAAVAALLVVYLILMAVLYVTGAGARKGLEDVFLKDNVTIADPAGTQIRAATSGRQKLALESCLTAKGFQLGVGAGRQLSVEESGTAVWVRTTTEQELFKSGSAEPEPSLRPLLEAVADCMKDERGPITVVGYTDSAPSRFPGNQRLSEARARNAAGIIGARLGGGGERVRSEGKGDLNPVSSVDRLNRRVEIRIERVS